MRKPRFQVLVGLSLVSFVMGCGSGNEQRITDIQALTGNVSTGSVLYQSNCTTCHGADGKSGTILRNITREDTSSILEAMISGKSGMPSFESLTDQDLSDIAAYVDSLQ